MQPSFLQSYLAAFQRIQGWFAYDAALLFMAYNELIRANGISGDVLEIGVYHGLSSIAVAALRGPGRQFYAIDLFEELQANEAYGSGAGYRKIFEENVQAFHGTRDFVVPIASASGKLKSDDFPHSFSFCHVDGGHSPRETYDDLKFASDLLMPGGLLALDDYFNPQHPGVCEGTGDFMRRQEQTLKPLAIGYNKVLFQKLPSRINLNAGFSKTFPGIQHSESTMWNAQAFLFGAPLRTYFDLCASTPERLVLLGEGGVRATFSTGTRAIRSHPGQTLSLPVTVSNTSNDSFPHGERVFGLSYHLLSAQGQTLQHDNPRSYLSVPLQPGDRVKLDLQVVAPPARGRYQLEIDLVWEDVMWFKDAGNPAYRVELEVA